MAAGPCVSGAGVNADMKGGGRVRAHWWMNGGGNMKGQLEGWGELSLNQNQYKLLQKLFKISIFSQHPQAPHAVKTADCFPHWGSHIDHP